MAKSFYHPRLGYMELINGEPETEEEFKDWALDIIDDPAWMKDRLLKFNKKKLKQFYKLWI